MMLRDISNQYRHLMAFLAVVAAVSLMWLCNDIDLEKFNSQHNSPPPYQDFDYELSGLTDATPYNIIKTAYDYDSELTAKQVVQGAKRTGRTVESIGEIAYESHAQLLDYGDYFLTIVRYAGDLLDQQSGRSFPSVSEIRYYYHSTGAVTIQTACFTLYSDCSKWAGIVERFEALILQAIESENTIDFQSVADECKNETSVSSLTKDDVQLINCWFKPGVSIQARKLDTSEAQIMLAVILDDSELKQLFYETGENAQ